MCFKKILLALSIFVFSAIIIAGEPVKTEKFYTRGVYVDINAGYSFINWEDFSPTHHFTFTNNGRGGFTIGGDTGYEYSRYFAFELGWYYLPQVKYNTLNSVNFKVYQWAAYFGFTVFLPVSEKSNFFGKLALACRYIEFNSSPGGVAPDGSHYLWRALGALGWRYYFSPNWSMTVQYMYLPGEKNSTPGAVVAPVANLVTIGYSYKFEI